jgi:hypothetical protein
MSDDASALATAEEIRAIADGAHDILLDVLQEDAEDAPEHSASDRLPLAFAALHFCARAAQELGDPGLFEAIADPFTLRVEFEDYSYPGEDADAVREATSALLALQTRLPERAIELSSDESAEVRRAIAAGLRPEVAGAPALLRKLSVDPDPNVRAAARESLGVHAPPWWTGMLSVDPVATVGEAEATRLRPTLDAIAVEMASQEHARPQALARIVELARDLPAEIAADVAEHSFPLVGFRLEDTAVSLATLLLAGPDAEASLGRVLDVWGTRVLFEIEKVSEAIRALPAKRRAAMCTMLANRALEGSSPERYLVYSPPASAGKIAAHAWPEALDAGFVIDAIDAADAAEDADGECDQGLASIAHAFARARLRGEQIDKLADRLLAPPSAAWRRVGYALREAFEARGARVLRRIAERAAASANDELVRWGLECLAGPARSKRDPPVAALLRAWCADPRLRRQVARSFDLRGKALGPLRAALRAGQLEFEGAVYVISSVGAKHGRLRDREPKKPDSSRALTNADWVPYRAARDRAAIDGMYYWHHALHALPPGPRSPADRAFFARIIAAAKEQRLLVDALTHALEQMTPDDGSLADAVALVAVTQGDDKEKARKARDAIAAKLGVIAPAEGGDAVVAAPAPAPRAREWMDEPEPDE